MGQRTVSRKSQAQIVLRGHKKSLLQRHASRVDLLEVADALGDMLYILCGTILTHGMQHKITEVFEEIQRSNMSKLGADGNPIYREDGKVMKGPNYFKPNIEAILKR